MADAQAPVAAEPAAQAAQGKGDPAKAKDVLAAVAKAMGGDKVAALTTFTAEGEYKYIDRTKGRDGNAFVMMFVVERDWDVIRQADWLVDVGPAAGEKGGEILYSGPPEGLRNVQESQTRQFLFDAPTLPDQPPRLRLLLERA